MDYYQKYLKYKAKYLELRRSLEGGATEAEIKQAVNSKIRNLNQNHITENLGKLQEIFNDSKKKNFFLEKLTILSTWPFLNQVDGTNAIKVALDNTIQGIKKVDDKLKSGGKNNISSDDLKAILNCGSYDEEGKFKFNENMINNLDSNIRKTKNKNICPSQ
jgi:hypothetical protein